MTDDIFKVLQDEMNSDTDTSGVPKSSLFWDDALSTVADAYAAGAVSGNAHLEMRSPAEQPASGSQEIVVSPDLEPFTVEQSSNRTLVGSSTDRDMSILPLTIQIQSSSDSFIVPAWLGVTRGGQRWVRLGENSTPRLYNLDEVEEQGNGSDPLLKTLHLATRMQQVHMGVDLPEPSTTPLDLLTSIAVQQAAHAAAHTPAPRDLYTGGAARALSAQVVMRVASVRALLNLSPAVDGLPVDALVRLDALSERIQHLGCGRPNHSSRTLSPGATAVLQTSIRQIRDVTWDDVRAEDLTSIAGIDTAEAKWWGSRGIAEVCKHTTGSVSEAWSALSTQVGPYLDPILSDAERLGLVLPHTS